MVGVMLGKTWLHVNDEEAAKRFVRTRDLPARVWPRQPGPRCVEQRLAMAAELNPPPNEQGSATVLRSAKTGEPNCGALDPHDERSGVDGDRKALRAFGGGLALATRGGGHHRPGGARASGIRARRRRVHRRQARSVEESAVSINHRSPARIGLAWAAYRRATSG